MSLRIFPEIEIDADEYRQALANALHDATATLAVPLGWYGTIGYQRFIDASGIEAQQKLLAGVYRGVLSRRTEVSDLEKKIADMDEAAASGIATTDSGEYEKCMADLSAARAALECQTNADTRLRVAMLYWMENADSRSNQSNPGAAPVFNIYPQIDIEQPPAHVTVNLPDRIRTTEVERDPQGNIRRAVQIETDAATAD
jgi:hypothetical protein